MSGPIARILGIALVASSASIATPASSATTERFEDGLAAYERNDYEKSMKTLRPLAEKGDARAQYLIGRQYQFGQGTKANRAEAYYWYKRAESKGHAEAKLFRQLLEKRWNISAADKARGERKLAEANAPPKTVKAQAKPKPKPEKPQIAAAAAREPPKPEITSKPSVRVTPAQKPAEKPALVAAKTPAAEEPSATLRSRLEPARPASPPARDDDDDGDTHADSVTTSVPPSRTMPPAETRTMPPAETRTAMAPPGNPGYAAPDTYPADNAPPVYAPPAYAPPAYTPPPYSPPTYAPPPYSETAPPYYAPSAPPSWRPPPYYAARPYYRPVWGPQRYRAYVHLGWRGHPRAGYRRGRW